MNHRRNRGQNVALISGLAILGTLILVFGRPQQQGPSSQARLRLAYFPNVTHAPALVGVAHGEFQKALGARVTVDPRVFNAGPEAMEALLAGEIDIAYVGPGPAINTYLKSNGRALRIIAGACNGGAALVARPEAHITTLRDLNGKRVAVPQLGGTQDISLRHFLAREGLGPQEKGGGVQILPIKNPDILTLFLKGEIDAAWVPEPWASRLIKDAHAQLVIDERDLWPDRKFTTTVVVARNAYLEQHGEEVQEFLQAHLRTIAWLQQHGEEAPAIVNGELKRLTGKALPRDVLQQAWGRVTFTADPNRPNILAFVQAGAEAGYLPADKLNVADLLDLNPLATARRSASVSIP